MRSDYEGWSNKQKNHNKEQNKTVALWSEKKPHQPVWNVFLSALLTSCVKLIIPSL